MDAFGADLPEYDLEEEVTGMIDEYRNPGAYQRVPLSAGCDHDGGGRYGCAKCDHEDFIRRSAKKNQTTSNRPERDPPCDRGGMDAGKDGDDR